MTQSHMTETIIGKQVEPFTLPNHNNLAHSLNQLRDEQGILIGLCHDIWDISAIRHVLWFQRHVHKLSYNHIGAALIMPTHAHELNGFYLSIPRQITFPLLADYKRETFAMFGIESSGFVALDGDNVVRKRWFMQNNGVPHMRDVLNTLK